MLLPHYTCNRNEYCGNLHVYNYIYYRFLEEVTCNGNEKLLQNYLELHPDCSHLLAVLQHGRRDETDDITMMWWERGNWLCVFIQVFFLGFLRLEPVLLFTARQLSGSRLLTSASLDSDCFTMEAHSHFSLTTGRPVVLDIAVHFHCCDNL